MNPQDTATLIIKISSAIMGGFAFQIKTPQALEVFHAISHWLSIGISGGAIVGPSRFGKTSAIRWALKAIPRIFHWNLPVFEIPMRRGVVAGERDFFEHILLCVNHRNHKSGTSGDKRNRLVEFLSAKGRATVLKIVILWFDEAQWLLNAHHDWLVNVSNELVKRGVKPFFLFSGTMKFANIRQEFITNGEHQITARHLSQMMMLRGVGTAVELKACLTEFADTIYPVVDRKKMPEHFANPKIYPNFNLPSCARKMWTQFERQKSEAGLEGSLELPMHFVAGAMMQLLKSIAICEKKQSLASLIRMAVEGCGFKDYLESTRGGEPDLDISRASRKSK